MEKDLIIKYYNECRKIDFPFPSFSNEELVKDIKKLSGEVSLKSNAGLKIIYSYHPSLWLANKENRKSPVAGWNDDELLIRVIENRLHYKGKDLSIKNILDGFTISEIAPKVSLFRPALAKYLVTKYLNEYDTIFDPCAGYSGRMLGTCVLNKKYIGQDINLFTVDESNKIIKNFNLINCAINNVNSLGSSGSYDCLFTCPPYGSKENWHQSIEELSCDEWIDVCLNNYKCKSYLFVVDKTEKYKNYIAEEIVNKSHFSRNTEKVILINRVQKG